MAHILVVPSFWCALNLFSFIMIITLGMGVFMLFDARVLNAIDFEYGTYCQHN